MITIVDCGINNLRSVQKAFEAIGCEAAITRDPEVVRRAEKVVLPGVGAFGAAMDALHRHQLIAPILESIRAGTPFLGICLAMQLLTDCSDELGSHQGLGVVAGRTLHLPEAPGLKIPHMGWSPLQFPRPTRLFAGLPADTMMYFVHSYYVAPDDAAVVAATARHGITFACALEQDNVMAVQFHPEKSSAAGQQVLRNFAELS